MAKAIALRLSYEFLYALIAALIIAPIVVNDSQAFLPLSIAAYALRILLEVHRLSSTHGGIGAHPVAH